MENYVERGDNATVCVIFRAKQKAVTFVTAFRVRDELSSRAVTSQVLSP